MKRAISVICASVVILVAAGLGYSFFSAQRAEAETRTSFEQLSAGTSMAPAGVVSSSLRDGYDLSAHRTLSRVIVLIKENYVDPDRVVPYEMFLAALDYIEKTAAEVIVDESKAPHEIAVVVGSEKQVFDLERTQGERTTGLDQLWEVSLLLRDIFRFLQTHIEDPDQRRDIEYAAINGMLSTLDPHSVLMKPENFDEMKLSTKGEFGGLGIVISIRDGTLTVISPLEDTPAARAGVKALDQIVKINDVSTINMRVEEAVELLRGKPGSEVAIWLKRKGWTEAKRFVLVRSIIKIKSVTSEMMDDRVGYVKLKSFQANTSDDLNSHLEKLRERAGGPLKGLILDLRNNPGGLLDQAILVSDRFVEQGPLVITVGGFGDHKREVRSAHGLGTETSYPMAILVNGGSASASEIVSGAIKNNDRGVIIGEQTFGKGSVQVVYDFKDQSALKLTIAQYLTPGDISIQSTGIQPDIEIAHATVSDQNINLFVHDSSPRESDLDRHLETPEVVNPSALVDSPLTGKEPVQMVRLDEESTEDERIVRAASDEFQIDFEIELAHQLLKNAKSTDRRKVLAQGRDLLKTSAHREQERIIEKLSTLDVDWREGKSSGIGSARVVLDVKSEGQTLDAGETLGLVATVTNTGKQALYRVYGVSSSENPLLEDLEFVFGKIEPGASKSWPIDIKLPTNMPARADELEITIGDMNDSLKDVVAKRVITIEEREKPHFNFIASVNDRKTGNGDGVLQIGEKVEIDVRVQNVGDGDAPDASVTLRNLSHGLVDLSRGRAHIGELKTENSADVSLSFKIKEPSRSAVPGGRPIDKSLARLRLSVWDAELGGPVSGTIEIPVMKARRMTKRLSSIKVAPNEVLNIHSGAHPKTRVLARARAGAVLRSDAHVGDWYRVKFTQGVVGYIRSPSSDVKTGRKARRASSGPISLVPFSAPVIELELDDLVTDASTLQLEGAIRHQEGVKDVFVFLNDKKIFYKSFSGYGASTRSKLELPLELEEGSNAIAVVARRDEDLIAQRSLGVYRTPKRAVAEHSIKAAKTADR